MVTKLINSIVDLINLPLKWVYKKMSRGRQCVCVFFMLLPLGNSTCFRWFSIYSVLVLFHAHTDHQCDSWNSFSAFDWVAGEFSSRPIGAEEESEERGQAVSNDVLIMHNYELHALSHSAQLSLSLCLCLSASRSGCANYAQVCRNSQINSAH